MKAKFSISFKRFIMALSAFGLIATAVALFGVTYIGSITIAKHEIARSAKSNATLARLTFSQHLNQLEAQIRNIASNEKLVVALRDRDVQQARSVLEQSSARLSSASLDLLLIDLPGGQIWVNSSLGLIDVGNQLPSKQRKAMSPDIWTLYSDDASDMPTVTAAFTTTIVDPLTGDAVGRIYGGSTLTDSFALPGAIAQALDVQDLAFYFDDKIVAGLGSLTRERLPQSLQTHTETMTHVLESDFLLVRAPLFFGENGHILSVGIKQPVDTLQKVTETYNQLFPPFLLYIAALSVIATVLVNWVTGAGLDRLINYATNLRQDHLMSPPKPGFILEFNKLALMFEAAFESVRDRDAQFKELIDGSMHGVLVHANNRILYVNDALSKMLGYGSQTSENLVDLPTQILYAPDEHDRLQSFYGLQESSSAPRIFEIKGIHKDGHVVWFEQHVRLTEWKGTQAYYATITNISERKRQEALATKNANYDLLTGLPNRRLLMDRLFLTIQRSKNLGERAALMVLDLDRFKTINEMYGPKVGDRVIKIVADRLTALVGADHTVARTGGDEFAIILSNPDDRWQTEQVARALLKTVSDPMDLGAGVEVVLSCSMGITFAPLDSDSEETLLLQADTSMYQAKTDSGPSYRFFSVQTNEQITRASKIEILLRKAIERRELELNFQPIMDYAQNRITGCEALCRWRDPELGNIQPVEFIKIAEESGLIVPLGDWVLAESCRFFKACEADNLKLGYISVNVSPRQFRDNAFIDRLKKILAETQMDPTRLHLEITESVMFDNQRGEPAELLEAVSALGVKLSLDDFGTGYSSLSYLKRLPIDTLKVDSSFVTGMERDADSQVMVKAILSMAASLGIDVICEGADTREQCELLRSFGCSLIQGFLIARPMSGADLQRFLGNLNTTEIFPGKNSKISAA